MQVQHTSGLLHQASATRPAGGFSPVVVSWAASSTWRGYGLAAVPTVLHAGSTGGQKRVAGRGGDEFRFRNFQLLPGSRTLLRDGRPIDCGSRAFDLLHVLLLSRGNIVSKDDIVSHVWPSTFVEDSNLRYQVASLRRVLGADGDLIKTVQGRGYLFAADASESFGSHLERAA